jgi:hypothetical protein
MKAGGVSKHLAQRLLAAAYAEFDRQASRRKQRHLGVALAERARAKRLALTKVRHLVVGGAVTPVSDPDEKSYLAACDSEAKLLGLNAPERHELVVQSFGFLMQDWVQALVEEVVDVDLRRRIVARMQRLQESRLEGLEEGRAGAPAIVEGERVLPPSESPPADPSTNGHA